MEVRPRCVHHVATAVRGPRAARRDHHPSGHQPQPSSPHARILAGLGGSRAIPRQPPPLGAPPPGRGRVVAGGGTPPVLLGRPGPGGSRGGPPRPAPPPRPPPPPHPAPP